MPRHIARLILVIVGFAAFALFAKSLLTADTFHEFGHYRGDSVIEIAAREPVFQTPSYCESCHTERVAQWAAHSHKTVGCETCHGPAKGHPGVSVAIPRDTPRFCGTCHEAMAGRPRSHPQIDIARHTVGEACVTCHDPHSPKVAGTAAFAGTVVEGRKP